MTISAWMIMAGSVTLVLLTYDRIAGLPSLRTRDDMERMLGEAPAGGLGVDVDTALEFVRVTSMVAAGCAVAAAILGYHVLKRNRSARWALTVLAVPLFLTGLFTGAFFSSVVAVSALTLWSGPARAWFDVRCPPVARSGAVITHPSLRHAVSGPPGAGRAPAVAPAPPLPAVMPAAARPTTERPTPVLWACGLTWVFSGLCLVPVWLSVGLLVASPGLALGQFASQYPSLAASGVTEAELVSAALLVGGLVTAWCALASALATLAFRGANWARLGLVAAAVASGAASLAASLAAVVLLVPATACLVTVSLLVRPEVRAWFTRR